MLKIHLIKFLFRQITESGIHYALCSVRHVDWQLLGMFLAKFYFVDTRLPFGSRSSPYIFNTFADALTCYRKFFAVPYLLVRDITKLSDYPRSNVKTRLEQSNYFLASGIFPLQNAIYDLCFRFKTVGHLNKFVDLLI